MIATIMNAKMNTTAGANDSLPQRTLPRTGVSQAQYRSVISRVMSQSDDLVLVLEYSSKQGELTRRIVSPIRFEGDSRFLALCLSRQEPRQFVIDQCKSIRVDLALRYVMPVELEVLQAR